jgi:hypothetical protein
MFLFSANSVCSALSKVFMNKKTRRVISFLDTLA